MLFTLFRYCLIPVVLYCLVVITAGIDAYTTNAIQKSTWPQTTATVMESQDFGDAFAEFSGTKNNFPDPRGTLQYVIDGETYSWQGRGRDIGLTAMTPGDKITLYYNPANKQELSTLVLLGAFTGNIIMAVAFAFLAFYFWFFWLRGMFRRSGPGDFDGDAAFESRVRERRPSERDGARFTRGDQGAAAITNGPAGRRTTFGKR